MHIYNYIISKFMKKIFRKNLESTFMTLQLLLLINQLVAVHDLHLDLELVPGLHRVVLQNAHNHPETKQYMK